MPITVRRAYGSDVPAIKAVHLDSMIHGYPFLCPRHLSTHADADETRIRHTESVFVAVHNFKEIIGFFEVMPTQQDGVGKIHSLFVCSAFWGRRVGTRLLNDAEQRLCLEGYHTGELWVFSGNKKGGMFYEKRGWKKTGHAKSTDWPGLDGVKCYKLQKTLQQVKWFEGYERYTCQRTLLFAFLAGLAGILILCSSSKRC